MDNDKMKGMELFLVVLYILSFLAFYQGLSVDESRFEQEDSGEYSE